MAEFVVSHKSTSNDDSEKLHFYNRKHFEYILKVSSDKSSFEFVVSEHFRMSGELKFLLNIFVSSQHIIITFGVTLSPHT